MSETPAGSSLLVIPAWGTLEALSLTRVLVTGAVLMMAIFFGMPLAGRGGSAPETVWVPELALYVGFSLVCALIATFHRRHYLGQIIAQLGLDLIMATVLVVLSGGMRSEFLVFYLMPVAGGSLLLPTSAALFTTSIAVLVLLTDAVLRGLREDLAQAQIFQAGLFGAALFGITALLRLLSARLKRQEALARERGLDLQGQWEINRMVISQMEQGVIVVTAATVVRANNQAARALLGMPRDAQLTGSRLVDMAPARALAAGFLAWRDAGAASGDWSNVVLAAVPGGARAEGASSERLLNVRFARPPAPESVEYVIFLEDRAALEARAQQLKLAAMGRLTASIAHEIRNPLAAISNAGQLLGEDARDAAQARLVEIMRENTARLNRLVDDVLRVARREPPLLDQFDLRSFVERWLLEFVRDRGVAASVLQLEGAASAPVAFEQGHLRQILFNLVDNALRYCSGGPASVRLVVDAAPGAAVQLWIVDDGPGVAPGDRGAMFEPFFTTHALGTGLGLFMAREFCVANRAELAYDVWPAGACEGFVVRFAADRAGAEESWSRQQAAAAVPAAAWGDPA